MQDYAHFKHKIVYFFSKFRKVKYIFFDQYTIFCVSIKLISLREFFAFLLTATINIYSSLSNLYVLFLCEQRKKEDDNMKVCRPIFMYFFFFLDR